MLVWKDLGRTSTAASCSKNHPTETNHQKGVQLDSGTGVQAKKADFSYSATAGPKKPWEAARESL